jgi:hypothetical protein
MSVASLFIIYSYVLNMFRTLIYPSSGACDYSVELPHWSFCSWFAVCWRFGAVWFILKRVPNFTLWNLQRKYTKVAEEYLVGESRDSAGIMLLPRRFHCVGIWIWTGLSHIGRTWPYAF